MSNMLNNGLDWLEQKMADYCSSPAEYRREAQSYPLSAIFGKTEFEVENDEGISVGAFVWDFLIASELLGFEPEAGDIVAADGRLFEVMNLPAQGCWRWTSPNRKTYRIHTKEVGSDV